MSVSREKSIVLAFLIFIGLIGFISIASGAEYLGSISYPHMTSPGRLATGPDGSLYVTDGYNRRVFIFDRTWRYAGSISFEGASAVAVAGNGTVYIGDTRKGEVAVYRGGQRVGTIGSNEIGHISDIAVDRQTGDIYVTDYKNNMVWVYGADGVLKGSIQGLYLPQAVDVEGGRVYVLDLPKREDPDNPGMYTTGTRVSVFDSQFNLLVSFEDWLGYGGHLFRPQDIEVASDGRIYIAEGYYQVVMVYAYDSTVGNYVYEGEFSAVEEPFNIARSLAFSPDEKRLYVCSNMTKKVVVFSMEGVPHLQVSPVSLSFSTTVGVSPASQQLSIQNTGTGPMGFIVEVSDGWLVVSPSGGTVAAGGSAVVTVGVDVAGLSEGSYTGIVEVRSDAGEAVAVQVSVEVMPAPRLVVNPLFLGFEYTIGGALPPDQVLTIGIENDPQGVYGWSVRNKPVWVMMIPVSGQGDTLTQAVVGVDVTGLAAGVYEGEVVIEAPGVEGSPQVVGVRLTVYSVGSIHVVTNLQEATFTVRGPGGVTYSGSGTDWRVDGVADGSYTIEYGDVSGYITPASETKVLSGGGVLEFRGEYRKALRPVVVMGMGKGGSEVKVADTAGAVLSSFEVLGGVNGVDVEVVDVDGDGAGEVVAGQLRDGGQVGVYDAGGRELVVFDTGAIDGVRVSGGDLDGDGGGEIVVLEREEGVLKVYDVGEGVVVDTGLQAEVKGKAVAVADVDGDRMVEVLVLRRGKAGVVEVWSVSGGVLVKEAEVMSGMRKVRDVAGGDVDGDGVAEVAVGGGLGIGVYTLDGEVIGEAYMGRGVRSLALGDTDADGLAEVVVGKRSKVKVYEVSGRKLLRVRVFGRKTPVMVSTGYTGI